MTYTPVEGAWTRKELLPQGPIEGTKGWEARVYDDSKLLQTVKLKNGLANNHVNGVDFQGDVVWVATSKGVSRGILRRPRAMSRRRTIAQSCCGLLVCGLPWRFGIRRHARQADPAPRHPIKDPAEEPQRKRKEEHPLRQYSSKISSPSDKYVKEPYKKFWVEGDSPVMFWGPGRDKPDPEVATVKIGVIAPVERSYETYVGRSVVRGMQMALEMPMPQAATRASPSRR